MNLNELIVSKWQSDVTLNGLCNVERLFFEEMTEEDRETLRSAKKEERPYAVWITIDDSQSEVTSEAFYDEELYNLVIYADTLDEVKNIQRESRRVLRTGDMSPDDDGTVVLFEKRGGSRELQDGLVYMALDEYAVTRQRSR